MDQEDRSRFADSGSQRGLFLALMAVIRNHPQRQRAIAAALKAIDTEIAAALHMPDAPEPWLDALQDMRATLERFLYAEFPGRRSE